MGEYRGVGGIARKITKEYRGVNAVARRIVKAYRGVNNVARQYLSSGYGLKLFEINNRGAVSTYTENDGEFYCKVSGGDGVTVAWSTTDWRVCKDGRAVKVPAGTTITFSFTGTRYGSYCDYYCQVYTDAADVVNSQIFSWTNQTASSKSYTLTEDAYIRIGAGIGNIVNTSLYASITITQFELNGVDILKI